MKPTTKFEKEVVALAEKLPPLSAKDKEKAKKHCFDNFIITHSMPNSNRKIKFFCSSCGHNWVEKYIGDGKYAKCPKCNKKLKLKSTKQRIFHETGYFTLITTDKDYQVCRIFFIEKDYSYKYIDYFTAEISREYINSNGQSVILARNKRPFSYYYKNPWNLSSPMTVKKPQTHNSYYYDEYQYNFYTDYNIVKRVLPIIKRNGFNGNFCHWAANKVFKTLLTSSRLETLYKAKFYGFFERFVDDTIGPYWDSIKICIRNNYNLTDERMLTLWKDTITMMKELELDTRNPKFVCPDDLEKWHNTLVSRIDKKHAEERLKKQLEQIMNDEAYYANDKSKFLGIEFHNKTVNVKVIPSVKEFFLEGEAMHHCVFTAKYYNHKDSLILSARDNDNNRLATIEYDLNKYKVLQCKGINNSRPKEYDTIIQLIDNNKKLFRKAKKLAVAL